MSNYALVGGMIAAYFCKNIFNKLKSRLYEM